MREPLVFRLHAVHPFWRAVLAVLAIGLLGFFLFFGLVMVAVFGVLALVSGLVLAIRGWWRGRRLGGAPPDRRDDAIEGEFIVVRRRSLERPRDPMED